MLHSLDDAACKVFCINLDYFSRHLPKYTFCSFRTQAGIAVLHGQQGVDWPIEAIHPGDFLCLFSDVRGSTNQLDAESM
jgi:hypothetical protein